MHLSLNFPALTGLAFLALPILVQTQELIHGSPGCNVDHSDVAGKVSVNHTIRSSGGLRSFLVHVPSNYQQKPTGLVLSYHGRNENSTYQEINTQFSNETYNPDWIVVYPQGLQNAWQGPTYAVPGVSDLLFTHDLLRYMREHYCVDDARIYANGKSNGGGFVGTLACDIVGGNFAAFSPVAGAFYTDLNRFSPCSPARSPLAIREYHGVNDTTIRYTGGRGAGGRTPPIPEWLHRWASRDGCSGTPPQNDTDIEVINGVTVTRSRWSCQGDVNVVEGVLIDRLRHTWPSIYPNLDNKGKVSVVDATAEMMEFYRTHTKPLASLDRQEL